MPTWTIIVGFLLFSRVVSQDRSTPPTEFVIARHTFIDVGPPNDFYELIYVRQATAGSSVEKVTLTPPTDKCYMPAKVERVEGTLNESVAELIGKTNPCTISEKDLQRERKRCKLAVRSA